MADELTNLENQFQAEASKHTRALDKGVISGLAKVLLSSILGGGALGAGAYYLSKGETTLPPSTLKTDEEIAEEQRIKRLLLEKTSGFTLADIGLAHPIESTRHLLESLSDSADDLFSAGTIEKTAPDSKYFLPTLVAGAAGGSYLGYTLLKNYMAKKDKDNQLEGIRKRRQLLDAELSSLNPPVIEKKTVNMNDVIGAYIVAGGGLGLAGYLAGVAPSSDKKGEELMNIKNNWALDANDEPVVPTINSRINTDDTEEYDNDDDLTIALRDTEPEDNSQEKLEELTYAGLNDSPEDLETGRKKRELLKISKLLHT